MNPVSEQINKVIEENGGNVRDALNKTLAKLELAVSILEDFKKENTIMFDALKRIEQFSDCSDGFKAVIEMKRIASSVLED